MKSDIENNKRASGILPETWKQKLLNWVRLTNKPVVKVYNGYGNDGQLFIFGHALALSPLARKKYTQNIWTNTLAVLRLFMVRPLPNAAVTLEFQGQKIAGTAEADGFFRFQWEPAKMPLPGWHEVSVQLDTIPGRSLKENHTAKGQLYVPHIHQYAVISDIDDTFLISYSSNLRKRLFVMLTENAYSRKPFDGVVKHYQALALAGTSASEPNPFFYVSSSEWNLYDYISEFSKKNELPKGICLLNQMKRLSQVWKAGQNNHSTKFIRISRVLQAFPKQQFILLGDDSQQDPVIYSSVVEHFPNQIKAVYLRNVYTRTNKGLQEVLMKFEKANIPYCHFRHSEEALLHSTKIGLFSTAAI